VERRYGPDVPAVLGDPQELKQVFLNLVINAGQAVRGEQSIRVVTRREGDRAVVLVEDDGCGIAPELLGASSTVLTTKPVGRARLGLSISYERHGGEITCAPRSDAGAFSVFLPLPSELHSRPPEARRPLVTAGRPGRKSSGRWPVPAAARVVLIGSPSQESLNSVFAASSRAR
jgi:nitrogen-specific signal transduction histidine kinase